MFVGDPDDVVDDDFGPGLPASATWTEENFDFAGYVTGFDPAALGGPRAAARASWASGPDEQLCLVTVGGSGVGGALLRRVMDAFPLARRRCPSLRFVVVTGPRIDPASLPAADGVEVLGYVPDLYRHLAACDLAVVQGGLTTSMELTALRKPFVYVPLRHHFEQNLHVRNRLDRYEAGRLHGLRGRGRRGARRGDRQGGRPRRRLPPGGDRRRGPGGGAAGRAALSPVHHSAARVAAALPAVYARRPGHGRRRASNRQRGGTRSGAPAARTAAILEGLPDAVVAGRPTAGSSSSTRSPRSCSATSATS